MAIKRFFVAFLTLVLPTFVLAAGNESVTTLPAANPNASSYSASRTWMQQEIPAILSRYAPRDFVYNGGLHATASGRTSAAFATEAFTDNGNRVRALANGTGGTAAIDYSTVGCAVDDIAWVIISAATGNALSNFARMSGTNYFVNCTDASRPALPDDSAWLMKVTIAGGDITVVDDYRVPASFVFTGKYRIDDPLYGAVGDNSTDNAAAIEHVLNVAPDGAIVEVPAGTFLALRNIFVCRNNITLQGTGAGSIIKAKAAFVSTGNAGLVEFGITPGALACASVSNITVRDLTLDGNSLAKSLGVRNLTTGLISHIQALNAGPTHAMIYTNDTTDLVIENNYGSGALGTYGDCIYVGGGSRTKVVNNTCYNFTRIGIVTEAGNAGAKSNDVLIQGNSIRHGNNATSPERNAGYFGENSCDIKLIGNTATDMNNTPGAQASIGYYLSIGSGGQCKWQMTDNYASGAQRGLHIAVDPTDSVTVSGFTVNRGTLANYTDGIRITAGYDIFLSHIVLGSNNWSLGRGVVVDSSAAADAIKSLTLRDSSTDPTATFLSTTATFHLFALGAGGLTSLVIDNVQGWEMFTGAAPTHMRVSNALFTHESASVASGSWMMQATQDLTVTNTRIIRSVGASVQMFKALDGAVYTFDTVTFDNLANTFDNGAAGTTMWTTFKNCRFTDTPQFIYAGSFVAVFDSNIWYNNAANGAIRANGRNLAMELYVRNNYFVHGTAGSTPLVLTSFAPTVAYFENNRYGTTILTTMTTAVQADNQSVLFANLGTRANSSRVFCSDCGVAAAPCAGGGNGTLAVRRNGAWDCL